MTQINEFLANLQTIGQNSVYLQFIEEKILLWNFISLLFGFIALLLELRLPLRYYWHLPGYFFQQMLEGFGLRPSTPIWGYCLDKEKNYVIPFAAVELLDPATKEQLKVTYSNYLGQYGFKAPSGNYYVRAIKNYYKTPSVLDPENLQLVQVQESFVNPVNTQDNNTAEEVNLELQPIKVLENKSIKNRFVHHLKTFLFGLGNGFLGLGVILSLFSWTVTQELVHGILLAVTLTLLFIKVYVLETIRVITNVSNQKIEQNEQVY